MDYKQTMESAYDRGAWQRLLHDVFKGKADFWSSPAEVAASGRLAKRALNIGRVQLTDGHTLAVYEVELQGGVDLARNRRGIRDLLTADWRGAGHAGAFMLCRRSGDYLLRFSYVSETWGFDKQGRYVKTATDTKRYTYLLGPGLHGRTAAGQFRALGESGHTLQDVTAAFSVEALTKEFYRDLFGWYLWAVDPAANMTFPNNTATEDDDRDDLETKAIRMITRIMFVWFIKQKGLVPDRIFDEDYVASVLKDFDPLSTTRGDYYNAILQNLFFGTLNRAVVDEDGNGRGFAKSGRRDIKNLYRYAELFSIGERDVVDIFAEVPFLNGGLFECLDKTRHIDGVEQCYNFDGFSRNAARFADGRYKHRAVVPNALFFTPEKGLLPILKRYNFTIEENTPEELQVALDPELLGKVFENLLGAYNPETKETARNQSGSFYTPREVVNYMVDESLAAYLGDTPEVRELFADGFEPREERRDRYQAIAAKLKSVKILDPACGSGAFPMGLLNRIADLLQRIEPSSTTYELKLGIIENCLYGSDIQSIAAQITKLRFFISLVCDCERDPAKPNFGIPTLPNLETKFVAADSLVAKKRKQPAHLFEHPGIEPAKAALAEIRHAHFSAKSASAKHRLREKDRELRGRLAGLLADDGNFAPEDAQQLVAWNPYDQNAVSPFFDPEWMFGVAGGFDIVIGNPPYVQLQNNGGALASRYQGCGYEAFARTGDIYCLFYERGLQLLKPGGHLCYITSNKWMRAGYGGKTRRLLADKADPLLLVDFAGVKVFESATVDTNILLLAKRENSRGTLCAVVGKDAGGGIASLGRFVGEQGVRCGFAGADSWVILSPMEQSIKRKIEAAGTPLKDWDIQINYGIKTGCNEAFIIPSAKRDEILAACHTEDERRRTAELIRPILRGRDIKRYGYEWAGLYVIATFPSRHYDIEEYPAVKQYLLGFGIERLEQTGKTHTVNGELVKSRKKTSNKWFETSDSIAYWGDFSKPKIVYPNMTKYMPFVYDNKSYLTNQKCFIVTGKHVAYLTAFFNSSIFKYCFRDSFPELQSGTRELSKIFFDKIPVRKVSECQNRQFQDAVEDIQKEYTKQKAQRIDSMLFDLYNLTPEERDTIGFVEIL